MGRAPKACLPLTHVVYHLLLSLACTARGTGIALEHFDVLQKIVISHP